MTENMQITSEVDRRNPTVCRFTSARTPYVGTKTVSNVQEKMMLMGRNTREKVQYRVDTQINPGVAEHGGSVADARDVATPTSHVDRGRGNDESISCNGVV